MKTSFNYIMTHCGPILKATKRFYLLYYPWLSRSSLPEVFCKKGVLRNFAKLAGKHLCQSLFFNKVAGLSFATLLKERLWHWFFPVNFAKVVRTPFLKEPLRWLLLIKGRLTLKVPYLRNISKSHNYSYYTYPFLLLSAWNKVVLW